jgi:hypothetical protein
MIKHVCLISFFVQKNMYKIELANAKFNQALYKKYYNQRNIRKLNNQSIVCIVFESCS